MIDAEEVDRRAHEHGMQSHAVDVDVTARERGRILARSRAVPEAAREQDAADRQRGYNDAQIRQLVEHAAFEKRNQRRGIDVGAGKPHAETAKPFESICAWRDR